MAIAISTMLSGQVAIPCTVSGVAMPPTVIPRAMKKARANSVGAYIGRPARAAAATATMAPAIQPAGKRARSNSQPPTKETSRVSARWRGFAGETGVTARACPCWKSRSNDGQVCASVMTYADAAELVRHCGSARLYRAAVPCCELRRSHRSCRSAAHADLSALARDLLHLVDFLWLGRPRLPYR